MRVLKAQYPDIPVTDGFNTILFNLLDELLNNLSDSTYSGISSLVINFDLIVRLDYIPELFITFYTNETNSKIGTYTEKIYEEDDYIEKQIEFGKEISVLVNNISGKNGFSASLKGIKDNNNNPKIVINAATFKYELSFNSIIGSSNSSVKNVLVYKGLYNYGTFNAGTFSQEESKYKKRKFPDAKTPDPSKSLEENYPEWNDKKDTTSKPTDSNPNNKEEYRPGKINNNKKDPNNNDNNSQKDSQDGKNTNKDIKDDTDSGKEIIDDINDPEQDPSDPDDDPIGETPDVLIPINPISDSGFVSLYNPSGFELRQLSQYLWSDNFINNIKKLFQDPMDAIIGLHMIFGSPTTGGKTNIKVGFVDTGVTANKITAQYFTIDCGTVNVREYFKDARDYDFCNISIYLPFVGIQKLNSKDLMDASVRVLATVDVVTGALLYEIDVTKKGLKQCLYTFSGNCAVQLPISAGSYSSAIANLIGIGAGIAGTVATGGALAPALISGIGSAAVNSHIDVQTSNSIGSNAGAMGIKKPYLIINRLSSYNANAYQKTQGYPSNKTAKIGSLKGVAKIKECHLEGIPATDEELEEIYTLLKQGVIL